MAVVGTFISQETVEELLAQQRPTSDSSYLQSGGGVSLVSGLTFRVSAGSAFIRGVLYDFPQVDLTLGAADATHPRFDLIVADSDTLTFHVIAGTPAASPALPDLDPLTQLAITQILVPAAAATIPTIVKTTFYNENAGESTQTTSGASIVVNSTSEPLSGTKCINATNAAADAWVKMQLAAAVIVASSNQLVLNIKSKAAWHASRSIQVRFLDGASPVGTVVAIADKFLGFVSSQTATYQQIVIPIGMFALPAGTTADTLELRVRGTGGSNIGWRADDIVLESSGVISTPSPTPRATSSVSGTLKTTTDVPDPIVETRRPFGVRFSKAGVQLDTTGETVVEVRGRLAAGTMAKVEVTPHGGSITSGTFKIRKSPKATYPAGMADITGAANLVLGSGDGVQTFTALSGWTKTWAEGDVFEFELFAFSGTAKSLTILIVPV